MEISEVDENLRVETDLSEPDLVFLDAKKAPFTLYGVFYDEAEKCYLRMPAEAANAVSASVRGLSRCTAGGRVTFRTDSPYIAIRAVMKNNRLMSHITLLGQSGFDCYHRVEGKDRYFFSFMPPMGMTEGYSAGRFTDGKMSDYTLNFPLYDGVKELYIALKKGSHIESFVPYKDRPVVYYGSSITQGGCASRPGNAYTAILSRRLGVDHINLGFSGSCHGEPAMADYLAGLDMRVLICDYDHNARSVADLKASLPDFYHRVRAARPELPILFLSAGDSLLKGDRAPWNEGYETRRQIVRGVYEEALVAGDRHVAYVDGYTLLCGEEWDACTVDGTHPNDFGFYRMALAIEPTLKTLLN